MEELFKIATNEKGNLVATVTEEVELEKVLRALAERAGLKPGDKKEMVVYNSEVHGYILLDNCRVARAIECSLGTETCEAEKITGIAEKGATYTVLSVPHFPYSLVPDESTQPSEATETTAQ